jgi:GxxExxY protein
VSKTTGKVADKHKNELSKVIIGACIEVHKQLGPGLLESVYEHCLEYELRNLGLDIKRQHPLPVVYKNNQMDLGFRLDIWVNEKVILEIKAVEALNDVHMAQVLTYLKLSDCRLGLLINFNVARLTDGLRRVVNQL